MNIRGFSALYGLLCDALRPWEESTSIRVRVSALEGRLLPVITQERTSDGGTSIWLYYPVSVAEYRRGQPRETIARINLANLYAGKSWAISGGLDCLGEQCFLYLRYDMAGRQDDPELLYERLYGYMDNLALWLGIKCGQDEDCQGR